MANSQILNQGRLVFAQCAIAILAMFCAINLARAEVDPPATNNPAPEEAPAGSAALTAMADAMVVAEQRVALVIGNSNYRDAPLGNPTNDARDMAIRLKELGFRVIVKEDATLEEMRKSVRDFGNQLSLGGVGLFYYAGHGIQSGGSNYLIPVDADIQDETELATRAFTASEVLEKMDAAKNRINIVILDACRNNPLTRKVRSSVRGLATMEQGSGTIIAFSTKPGSTSADGDSSHGLYTGELLQALSTPGLSVEEVFKQVRQEVSRKSDGVQIPWENSSLLGDFFFNPAAGQQRVAMNTISRSFVPNELNQSQSRDLARVLLPRRLLENYQLTANFPLSASAALVEFAPDGNRLVVVSGDKQLKVLDPATGNVVFSHSGFDVPNVSADGRYLVGASDERAVNVFDVTAGTPAVRTYKAVRDVQAAWIAPNGQRMLVASRAGTISVVKMDTDTLVGTPIKFDSEASVRFSPSGNRAVLWSAKDGSLLLVDVDTGKRAGSTSAHHKPIRLVRFNPDGSLLLTAADGDGAFVWRTSDGAKAAKVNLGDKSPLPSQAEFIDDGRHLLINVAEINPKTGTRNRLGIWDAANGKLLSTLLPDVSVSDIHFSPDRQQLYVTTSDRSLRVFDMNTHTARTVLSGAEYIGFSADGARLVVREGDGIRIYEAPSLTPIARMPGQIAAFIAPNTNGVFATAANDGTVRLWQFEQGDPVSLLKGHVDIVTQVHFAAGGKRLVSFSKERVGKIWGLPRVDDADKLRKDTYESSSDYQKRVAEWSSPLTSLVELGEYNADSETYTVKVGDYSFPVPVPRSDARRFAGQRQAMLSGKLKVFDGEQLQLADGKLERLP